LTLSGVTLLKSPKPSMEMTATSSNGDAKNALALARKVTNWALLSGSLSLLGCVLVSLGWLRVFTLME
jgi:hypothetical protein